jgi:hypothetical protein
MIGYKQVSPLNFSSIMMLLLGLIGGTPDNVTHDVHFKAVLNAAATEPICSVWAHSPNSEGNQIGGSGLRGFPSKGDLGNLPLLPPGPRGQLTEIATFQAPAKYFRITAEP